MFVHIDFQLTIDRLKTSSSLALHLSVAAPTDHLAFQNVVCQLPLRNYIACPGVLDRCREASLIQMPDSPSHTSATCGNLYLEQIIGYSLQYLC